MQLLISFMTECWVKDVEVDPQMELENIMALLEAEVNYALIALSMQSDEKLFVSLGYRHRNKVFHLTAVN